MHTLDNLIFRERKNCLDGLKFVIIGVLESIEREEAAGLIQWKSYPISEQENNLCRYGTGSWRA